MKIVAYIYSNPLLEPTPDLNIWGLDVDTIYQDVGKHQQLEKLIEDCRENSPDFLLLRSLEELGNNVQEISRRLENLESLGVKIIALKQDYLSEKINKLTTQEIKKKLTQIWQEIEKNQNSLRLQQGHARNRIKNLPPPGKAPYGYRRGQDKYILDRSTAPVVKDFCERFLLFGSLRGAVSYLEKRYGKKISVSTGRNWLINPVYRGNLAYKNGIILDTHTAIISPEEAAQIDRLLKRNSRLPSRSASAPRSLAGLVVCQKCQSTMTVTSVSSPRKKQKYLYLRPINCYEKPKCQALIYEEVLLKTIEKIHVDLSEAVANIKADNLETIKNYLKTQIEKKQEIILELPNLKKQGILDEDTLSLRSYTLKTEIAQLKNKLAQLPPVNLVNIAQTISLEQFWLDLSEAERRFYFREFIEKIEINRSENKNFIVEIKFIF